MGFGDIQQHVMGGEMCE